MVHRQVAWWIAAVVCGLAYILILGPVSSSPLTPPLAAATPFRVLCYPLAFFIAARIFLSRSWLSLEDGMPLRASSARSQKTFILSG